MSRSPSFNAFHGYYGTRVGHTLHVAVSCVDRAVLFSIMGFTHMMLHKHTLCVQVISSPGSNGSKRPKPSKVTDVLLDFVGTSNRVAMPKSESAIYAEEEPRCVALASPRSGLLCARPLLSKSIRYYPLA